MKLTEKDREDAENVLRMHAAKFPTPQPTPFHSDIADIRDMRDPDALGHALDALRLRAPKSPLSRLYDRAVASGRLDQG